MKIAVCIKQVPTRDWQPRVNEQKTWVRDQDASFELNEPDAYALEEGLRLKEKHGGEVVVCSAGPPRVAQALRESLARGADRAIHVEGEGLATADAFAVAEALCAAMCDEQFDIVLTGLQSDDQGFAQTGPILAELLGIPSATIIMEVDVQPGALRVKRELEGGWFQWVALPLPALLTVQSGINQLRYATLKGIMAAKKKEIRKVAAPAGVAPRQQIVHMYVPEKTKQTEMITGSAGDAAKTLVRKLRDEARVLSLILVIAEQQDGALNRASWEVVAAAQQAGGPVAVAVLGADTAAAASELAAAEVAEVVQVQGDALGTYTLDGFVGSLAGLIAAEHPAHVFLPHTYRTRDFAPALAVRCQRPLVTDCVGTKAQGGQLLFVRPVFQGRLLADVAVAGPALVTFQIGAVRADSVVRGASPAPVRAVEAGVDAAGIRQKPDAPFREAKQAVDLTQAERIVAVGRGIKDHERIALARELAAAMGAELGASRPICDAGWLPMDRQIGSSGQTVAPRLYVALGISGAIQHLVGMKGSRTIVAINKDPEAPVFEIADYGIVGDLFEIVPALIKELQG